MGKKKSQSGDSKNNTGGGEKKKEEPIITVVLKLDMHCEGCCTKIKKFVRSFKGVEVVKGGDGEVTKLTVIGKVDPSKLREAVEKKVKKKVELVSPAPPKKDNSNDKNGGDGNNENNNPNKGKNKGGDKGGDGAGEKDGDGAGKKKGGGGGEKNSDKQGEKKKDDKKKAKEPPVTTAVMKMNLHCQGCIQRVRKTITKTKGYLDLAIDEEKNQITVKGALDMKALAQLLSVKLKKAVEIVPPKKESEKKEKEKEKDGGGGGDSLVHFYQFGYPNMAYGYGYGYPGLYSAPQMFSDENPNACSVM